MDHLFETKADIHMILQTLTDSGVLAPGTMVVYTSKEDVDGVLSLRKRSTFIPSTKTNKQLWANQLISRSV